jgi:hypothetical protein
MIIVLGIFYKIPFQLIQVNQLNSLLLLDG